MCVVLPLITATIIPEPQNYVILWYHETGENKAQDCNYAKEVQQCTNRDSVIRLI